MVNISRKEDAYITTITIHLLLVQLLKKSKNYKAAAKSLLYPYIMFPVYIQMNIRIPRK